MSETQDTAQPPANRWLYWGAWAVAIALVILAVYLGWRVTSVQAGVPKGTIPPVISELEQDSRVDVELPQLSQPVGEAAISRLTNLHTEIPERPRQEHLDYTVEQGDSVFGIAKTFGLQPESVLWANYAVLNDNPDQLSLGMGLMIPPADGVLYEWQDGDTLQGVADRFEAKIEDIIGWSGNKLDLTNPVVDMGTFLMVHGGHREFKLWIVPTITFTSY